MLYKNSELLEISKKLDKAESIELPIKAAYAIVKNKQSISASLTAYHELESEIIKKYSNGKTSISYDDNPEGYMHAVEDISELNDQTTDVDIRRINLDDLGDGDISLDLMDAIGFMVDD